MDFPSDITLKVIGKEYNSLYNGTKEVFENEGVPDFKLEHKESRTGKFVSVSVSFVVQSPEQMERLYVALGKIPEVIMVI